MKDFQRRLKELNRVMGDLTINLIDIKRWTFTPSKAKIKIQMKEAHPCEDFKERQFHKWEEKKDSFHTYFHVNGKVYSLWIDKVSYTMLLVLY